MTYLPSIHSEIVGSNRSIGKYRDQFFLQQITKRVSFFFFFFEHIKKSLVYTIFHVQFFSKEFKIWCISTLLFLYQTQIFDNIFHLAKLLYFFFGLQQLAVIVNI